MADIKDRAREYLAEHSEHSDVFGQTFVAVDTLTAMVEFAKRETKDLKDRNQELLESCEGAIMIYKDLQKAKELLSRFLMASVYFNSKETDLIKETEQFLKGDRKNER